MNSSENDVIASEWDVALAGLLRYEYDRLARPLNMADVKRLAAEHGMRFNDLIVTLLQLCIHRQWRYRNPDGVERLITKAVLAGLRRRGRLHEHDFREYTGGWRPEEQTPL